MSKDDLMDGFERPAAAIKDNVEVNKEPSLGEQMAVASKELDKAKENAVRSSEGRNSSARNPRATREMDSREAESRELSWRPASVLPDPPQRAGWRHRWVRGSTRGETDKVNMSRSMTEGWRPCPADEYPEIVDTLFYRSEDSSIIEYGGLILCRIPEEVAKQRDEYFHRLAFGQINSVNERLRQEQQDENRIKYHNESSSSVKPTPF